MADQPVVFMINTDYWSFAAHTLILLFFFTKTRLDLSSFWNLLSAIHPPMAALLLLFVPPRPPTSHSGTGDFYVNASVNGSEWTWFKADYVQLLVNLKTRCSERTSGISGWLSVTVHWIQWCWGREREVAASSHDQNTGGNSRSRGLKRESQNIYEVCDCCFRSQCQVVCQSFVASVQGGLLFCSLLRLYSVSLNKVVFHFKLYTLL